MASMGAGASSGNIALRNCVQKSLVFTPELGKTALRVKSLHRDCLRSVAWTKRAYTVPLPEREMRALVSLAFREKSSISDMHQINRLIAMGRMDLEETLMLWKGESHIMQLFETLAEKRDKIAEPPPTFLDTFFDGK